MEYDIFISYRREGGREFARLIQQSLKIYGYNVFFDYDSLRDGVFNNHIFNAIQTAPIFLLVLSKQSMARSISSNDWVRNEIEHAIKLKKKIIPVNIDGEFDGFPEALVGSSSFADTLMNIQYSKLDMGELYDVSIKQLIDNRISLIVPPTIKETNSDSFILKIKPDADCSIYVDDKKSADATKGGITMITLNRGTYLLKFVSNVYNTVYVENSIIVDDTPAEILYISLHKKVQEKEQDEFWALKDNLVSLLNKHDIIVEKIKLTISNMLYEFYFKVRNKAIQQKIERFEQNVNNYYRVYLSNDNEAITIEVPRRVYMPLYWDLDHISPIVYDSDALLPIVVGKNMESTTPILDLHLLHNILVFGANETCKHSMIHSFINSINLSKINDLIDIYFCLNQFSFYNSNLTIDKKELDELILESQNRHDALDAKGYATIDDYNRSELNLMMRYIVTIVDIESFDCDIFDKLSLLIKNGGRVGIYLIVLVKEMSLLLKLEDAIDEFPTRIVFKVNKECESKYILTRPCAEKLFRTDEFMLMHNSSLNRMQCFLINNDSLSID